VLCFSARKSTNAFKGEGLRGGINSVSYLISFIFCEVLLVMCFSARKSTEDFKGEGLRGAINSVSYLISFSFMRC
jgi:preprotein translocase subunit SecG